MKLFIGVAALALTLALSAGLSFADNSTVRGEKLYVSEKYKCHTCHGALGEGTSPETNIMSIGDKYSKSEIAQKSRHNCEGCDPSDINAIALFLKKIFAVNQ